MAPATASLAAFLAATAAMIGIHNYNGGTQFGSTFFQNTAADVWIERVSSSGEGNGVVEEHEQQPAVVSEDSDAVETKERFAEGVIAFRAAALSVWKTVQKEGLAEFMQKKSGVRIESGPYATAASLLLLACASALELFVCVRIFKTCCSRKRSKPTPIEETHGLPQTFQSEGAEIGVKESSKDVHEVGDIGLTGSDQPSLPSIQQAETQPAAASCSSHPAQTTEAQPAAILHQDEMQPEAETEPETGPAAVVIQQEDTQSVADKVETIVDEAAPSISHGGA